MNLIELISLCSTSIAVLLVIFILAMNLYTKLRKNFPASVNCWFCNTWMKVPYEHRNSFECNTCLQYNGFNVDGSYNRVIEEQHTVTHDKVPFSSKPVLNISNGLCKRCNHNQQLKITQLANFTPLNEDNYDVEIDHFKNQLDKAYQLCKNCEKVLKLKLLKEKTAILGKHVLNIKKKSLNHINNSSISKLVTFIKFIQGILALNLISNIIIQLMFSVKEFTEYMPEVALPYLELIQDLYILISNFMLDFFSSAFIYFSFTLCDSLKYSSCVGLLLQLSTVLLDNFTVSIKMNQILCWSFLTFTSFGTTHVTHYNTQVFQIFCAAIVVYSSFAENSSLKIQDNFRKIPKSEDLCGYSDNDSEVSFNTARLCNSFNKDLANSMSSSFFSKKSDCQYSTNNSVHNSFNTARNPDNSLIYSNIKSGIESLHLNSTFDNSPTSSFTMPKSPRIILSPSKLRTVTQNSWVAGGFWRNEDGTIMPINDETTLSRSSSQSSGIGSQINENVFVNNPFNSLPTSRNNSICGDVDRFSLASEPAYHFKPVSPTPTWRSTFENSCSLSPKFRNSFGNIYKSSSNNFNEFVLPPANRLNSPMPLFSTASVKPLGLFKLPQSESNSSNKFTKYVLNQSANQFGCK